MSDFEPTDTDATVEDLARARDIMRGETPIMTEPLDSSVTLFRGIYLGNKWEDEARVKELTGADEEGIARMLGGASPVQYLNAVLTYGVSQVGRFDLEKMGVQERLGHLDMLLVGEKEFLFLNVLRVTYGDQRVTPVQCQVCQSVNEVTFSLTEDVPIRQMDDPHRLRYDFETRSGDRIEYRLVTGLDQAEAGKRPNTSTPEENTVILSRVIETVNGKPLVDPVKYVRDMGAMDRRNIMREITSRQPGPYFEEVKLPCATCGAESLFTPGWADLL